MRLEAIAIHEREVLTLEVEGVIYVVMKPVVESFGFAWNGQFERIKRHPAIAQGIRTMRIPSAGGTQEMVVATLDAFHGWLMSIAPQTISDEVRRNAVIEYQLHAQKLIVAHYHGTAATGPALTDDRKLRLYRLRAEAAHRVLGARADAVRRSEYDHYAQLSAQLCIDAEPIEGFGLPPSEDMARMRAIWDVINPLIEAGVIVNHRRNAKKEREIALNLASVEDILCKNGIQYSPARLRALLKLSDNPRFLVIKTINSVERRPVHCWVFQAVNTQQAATAQHTLPL